MATSEDFSVTNNPKMETDGAQILETPTHNIPSHNTLRKGMSQFTRETLQASVTEDGSQNEQQLPGYSSLDDAARKIPSRERKHPEEDDSESENSDQEYEDFKRFRVMSKDEKSSGICQIIWPNMLMSNFLCILQKRCYRRVL